ncbi:hypothetical protein ACM46_20845 [Chryseobacterium angstadtii]|uniref:RNA polymerase sigma-70 region 2 domain-containing protein n=1 Tax=Chryseobacterium angstadtii TaxID=558151 RepID=A0A0J7HZ79_9FLAO|nr:sigma-70 family RNA polymerase sigma factor [Chryseobacterium angstadtii]KMQ59533.1 hypothetical protein ACM46_20845 [Chryseobacterium angstadtii]
MSQFEKIYSEYKHRVYFFVKKYIQRDEDVEDVVQDIFVHVWKYVHKTDHPSAIEAIIFKTSKQEVANFYRKNKLVLVSSDQNAIQDTEDQPSEELYTEEHISKIEILLDKLPEKTKELFIQNKIKNLSYSQLAEENKISKVAIGKHINKAISFLKINLH